MRHSHVIFLCLFVTSVFGDSQSKDSREFSLYSAALNGKTELIRKLLAVGADVNGKYYAETPLIAAVKANKSEIVQFLLQVGANPNLPNAQGTPLSLAVSFIGNPQVVELLLMHGADPNLTYEKDSQKETPLGALTWLARYPESAQVEIAHLLLKAGSLVDQRSTDGRTPLRNAITWNKVALANVLLGAGANPNSQTDVMLVDFGTGEVPLQKAIAQYGINRDTSMVKLLLAFGADPNYRNDRLYIDGMRGHEYMWNGTTALELAGEMGHSPLVKLLLERGANPCINRTDGMPPHAVAINAGHRKAANLMLTHMKAHPCPAL